LKKLKITKLATRDLMLIPMFTALTAIGAFMKIDIPYIPVTLQFFFVALSGIILGSRKGMISQIVYILIGLVGFPVFTKGGGIGYVFQPTFGYLIGFACAAYVTGKVYESFKSVNLMKTYLAILAGLVVVYLIGVPYMYMINNFYLGKSMAVEVAVKFGLLATMPKELVVSFLVATLTNAIMPRLNKALLLR
jgi:biotin transport system substrate-specific component